MAIKDTHFTDAEHDEISELIKMENDPKNRAFLIILQNINLSLIANTTTVMEIDEQLKTHLVEFKTRASREDELLNKGKGAWRVVSYGLGLCQLIVIWLLLQAYGELRDLHKYDSSLDSRVTVLEQRK